MDALAARTISRADERRRGGREVVWSWPPDAEAKLAVTIRKRWGQESPVPRESTI